MNAVAQSRALVVSCYATPLMSATLPPSLPPETSILTGGVMLHTESLPWLRSVAVGLFVPWGSAYESAEESGAAHFIEHLVFKGTRRRTARDIALAIERHGGALNAATERELTSYYCRIDATHLETALDVLMDLCFQAEFRPVLVDRERTVVIEEIEGNQDDPTYFLFDQFLHSTWGNTGMGRAVTGTPESVAHLSRSQLWRLYRSAYAPSQMRLCVTGGVEHGVVAQAWEKVWRRQQLRSRKSEAPSAPAKPRFRAGVRVWPRPTEQASLILGVPAPPAGSSQRHAMTVLDGILAAGMGSRLFQHLRERKGLVYDVSAAYMPFRKTGMYAIEAGCNPVRLGRVVSGILQELRRLCDEPVPAAELRRIQDFLAGGFILSLESPSSRMYRLALSDLYLGHFESPEEILASVRNVTAADIRALAQSLFQPAQISLGIVMPDDATNLDRVTQQVRDLVMAM